MPGAMPNSCARTLSADIYAVLALPEIDPDGILAAGYDQGRKQTESSPVFSRGKSPGGHRNLPKKAFSSAEIAEGPWIWDVSTALTKFLTPCAPILQSIQTVGRIFSRRNRSPSNAPVRLRGASPFFQKRKSVVQQFAARAGYLFVKGFWPYRLPKSETFFWPTMSPSSIPGVM